MKLPVGDEVEGHIPALQSSVSFSPSGYSSVDLHSAPGTSWLHFRRRYRVPLPQHDQVDHEDHAAVTAKIEVKFNLTYTESNLHTNLNKSLAHTPPPYCHVLLESHS